MDQNLTCPVGLALFPGLQWTLILSSPQLGVRVFLGSWGGTPEFAKSKVKISSEALLSYEGKSYLFIYENKLVFSFLGENNFPPKRVIITRSL